MNKSEEKLMDEFKPFIKAAQDFVDKYIVGTTTMTVQEITDSFINLHNDFVAGKLTPAQFDKGFRLAIREGLITGIEVAHGKGKGYKRAGVILPRSVTISPDDWDRIRYRLHLTEADGLPEVLARLEVVAPMLEAAIVGVSALKKAGLQRCLCQSAVGSLHETWCPSSIRREYPLVWWK
jgi:hypothetical protein